MRLVGQILGMSLLEKTFFEIGSDIREKEKKQIGETCLDGEAREQECQAGGQQAQIDRMTDIFIKNPICKNVGF